MKIIKAINENHYSVFLQKCHHSDLSIDYLKKNTTYLLIHKDEICGGYVFGNTYPYRYTQHLTDQYDQQKMMHFTAYNNVTEITCLWIDKSYKKSLLNKFLWASIGYHGYFGKAEYYLFGTKSKKLTKFFKFPMAVNKFMVSEAKDKKLQNPFRFYIADRKKTFLGAIEIILGVLKTSDTEVEINV
ncbi:MULTISPECIES: hypothetical protein [Flammeovirga]|uniref:Uncharacterized protein n=1 Tax=Flammeovirga agarivorans TaxID=2726742 RepID=A0A7X8SHB4_9BACT|nr:MULTISPECIES: hypothetical protein [Flammeovirga]NLR90127.1 hypothetical protein [Flammeovirga agarivorans]